MIGSLPPDHAACLERARLSLDGLSVGDALGDRFLSRSSAEFLIAERALPSPPWEYTDDTEMALGIIEVLARHGRIEQEDLARTFARRYLARPARGYGAMAVTILEAIADGDGWQQASEGVFHGQGSMGNGAAMRVAPLGAYFADDLAAVVSEATASASVTHAHSEGIAGAIAVAVAAAWAWRVHVGKEQHTPGRLLEVALAHTPAGATRTGIGRAVALGMDASSDAAARLLGSGYQVTSPDTVPFTLWCADRHLDSYRKAIWTTLTGLGDIDTTCAIVGGIVALATGPNSIPKEWLEARETLRFGV